MKFPALILMAALTGIAAIACTSDSAATSAPTSAPTRETSVRPGINAKYFEDPRIETWQKAFETESREIYAKRKDIVAAVGLAPGTRVGDIGCGTGLFTAPFAAAVGPEGKVFAVDIVPSFTKHIDEIRQKTGFTNIEAVLCKEDSVELAANSIDVAFLCDVYHHFEYPKSSLASIRRALVTTGELVVIDFIRIPGKSREWVLNHVRAGQDVVEQEIAAAGFVKIDEKPLLAENYFIRFKKR